MYSETIKSSNEFHNRLATTHHLHFSNFLLSKIENDVLREETLAIIMRRLNDLRFICLNYLFERGRGKSLRDVAEGEASLTCTVKI